MAILMGAQVQGRERGWWMRLWKALAELRDSDSDASFLALKLTSNVKTV
jgi:hypothetical protein